MKENESALAAERRVAGSAEKRAGFEDEEEGSVAEAKDAPKDVGETLRGGREG